MHLRCWLPFTVCALLISGGCGGANVDPLIADLQSDDVTTRRSAAQQLGALQTDDPAVVTALVSAMSDPDREVRRLCCFALGETGAGQEILVAATDDAELSVRLAAAFALLKAVPEHDSATSVLTKAMQSGDGGVIVAVSELGPDARWAIPTLIELTRDQRSGIRRLAVEGLGRIGVASEEVFSALQRAERDQDDRVRESVVTAMNEINGH